MLHAWIFVQSKLLRKHEEGAGMVEYSLLIALIGVLLISALVLLRLGVATSIDRATFELNNPS